MKIVFILYFVCFCNANNIFVRKLTVSSPNVKLLGGGLPGKLHRYLDDVETAWSTFKKQFGKVFSSVLEEEKRFINFVSNFFRIKHHNDRYRKDNLSFILGINHLMDWSPAEVHKMLGFRFHKKIVGSKFLSSAVPIQLPAKVDWREKGAVSEVKNQGQCGSCWAFSTTGSLEGQYFLSTGKKVDLSEQQLVDCSKENNGCNGGIMDIAFQYIKRTGGIEGETDYPYVSGRTHQASMCHSDRTDFKASDTGFIDIPSGDEDKLKEAVATKGPISVAIDASHFSFQMYSAGVYEEPACGNNTNNLDHGVLVVGYGVDELSQKPYWLVKNSWGPTWGEKGFIRMARNKNNQCGVATMASYPLI